MADVEDFDNAHNDKLKVLTPEERAKAGLRKLAQEMEANKNEIPEPKALTSGVTDKDGNMNIDLEEDFDDDER